MRLWRLRAWWARMRRRNYGPGRRLTGTQALFMSSITLVIAGFLIIELGMDQTIVDIGKIEAKQNAIQVFSRELSRTIGSEDGQIFTVQNYGGQAFIHVDTVKFDKTAALASLAIQRGLKSMSSDPISIPIGQILGSKMVAAYGPAIPINLIPYGAVSIDFKEVMQQAGINQTMVTVYLDTDTMVQIVVPLVTQEVHLKVQVPLAQEWVVGKVPQTYLGSSHSLGSLSIPISPTTTSEGSSGSSVPNISSNLSTGPSVPVKP